MGIGHPQNSSDIIYVALSKASLTSSSYPFYPLSPVSTINAGGAFFFLFRVLVHPPGLNKIPFEQANGDDPLASPGWDLEMHELGLSVQAQVKARGSRGGQRDNPKV